MSMRIGTHCRYNYKEHLAKHQRFETFVSLVGMFSSRAVQSSATNRLNCHHHHCCQ